MNPLHWRFRVQVITLLALVLVLAVFAPSGFDRELNAEQLTDVLAAFVGESGLRSQQLIVNDFDTALAAVNLFANQEDSATTQALRTALITREAEGIGEASTQAANNVVTLLRSELVNLSGQQIASAWLMNRNGLVLASEVAEGLELPFSSPQQGNSSIFLAAETLAASGLNQELLITPESDLNRVRMEIVTVIRAEATDDVPTSADDVLGYLVVELNLNRIVLQNLVATNDTYETYGFLLLPDATTYLALPEVREAGLVRLTTPAVNAALDRLASRVLRYTVDDAQDEREVLGYYANFLVQGQRFVLVIELPLSGYLNTFADQRSFNLLLRRLLGFIIFGVVIVVLVEQLVSRPLNQLRRAVQAIGRGVFDEPMPDLLPPNELGALTLAASDVREQVVQLTQDMQARLDARNRDLRITQNIARATTNVRDLEALLNSIVQLLVDNFSTIYHAQVFIINEEGDSAILRASTGEAGRQLLARGHRLAVGSVSVIGQVTEQGQVVLARDTGSSDVHRRNEFLPETRAELAIPLRFDDRLLGALDVQSRQPDSFPPDQIEVLQILADQIAIAIGNVRLYEQTQRYVSGVETGMMEATRRAWQDYLRTEPDDNRMSRVGTQTGYDFAPLRQQATRDGKPAVGAPTPYQTVPFVVPIQLRNEVLGVIEYEVPQAAFDYDKVLLAEELVTRLAISLDNARLFQESQRSTQRERIVNEISARLTSYTDVQEILQTAIREVGKALGTSQVAIQLQPTAPNGTDAPNENGTPSSSENPSSRSE